MAGFVAENLLSGKAAFAAWDALEQDGANGRLVLDVREDVERLAFEVPGAYPLPLGELRGRMGELDKNKEVVVFCAIGVRAYNAARILKQNGFERVLYTRRRELLPRHALRSPRCAAHAARTGAKHRRRLRRARAQAGAGRIRHAGGLQRAAMPRPHHEGVRNRQGIEGRPGHRGARERRGLFAGCRRVVPPYGQYPIERERKGDELRGALSSKDGWRAGSRSGGGSCPKAKTLIVFSGDLDRVLASFIIANGAAAMGGR
jgi:rhodanese-related sulfurtransferase